MTRITSYFNPVSREHHALDNFKHLSGGEKILTVVLTALATIASLPILGLGGVATFRSLTNQFTVIDLNKETKSQKAKTAKKIATPFHDTFRKCSKEEAIRIIKEQQPNLNAKDTQGNTLIHIACMRPKFEFDEVIEEMLNEEKANFDECNNAGDLPISSYITIHKNERNEQIYEKMVLKMNQIKLLEGMILTNNNPDFLRKALEKLSDLGKPYQLKCYTDTTELFVILLQKAQTGKEVSDIVKYYQNEDLSVDPLGQEVPTNEQVIALKEAIGKNTKFDLREKELVLKKFN